MPCIYDSPREDYAAEYKKQLDKVTRLLCEVLSENPRLQVSHSAELRNWWLQHEDMDKKRIETEKRAEQQRQYEREQRISQLEAELQRLKSSDNAK